MRRAQQLEEESRSREEGLQQQIKHLQEQLSAVKQREEDTRQLANKTEENLRSEVSRLTTANEALESRLLAYGSDSDRSSLSGASYSAVVSGKAGVKRPLVTLSSQRSQVSPSVTSTVTPAAAGGGVSRRPPGLPGPSGSNVGQQFRLRMLDLIRETLGEAGRSAPHEELGTDFRWHLAHRSEAEQIVRVAELLLELFRPPAPPQ